VFWACSALPFARQLAVNLQCAHRPGLVRKSAFYEQVTGVKGSVFAFSFISVLLSLLLCLLRRMLLSTVFLCAL
jgi:hypothetical protein